MEEYVAKVKTQIEKSESEIARLSEIKEALPTATLETESKRNPEASKRFDKEIAEDNWHI